MSVFKPRLADALIEVFTPIRQRYEEISEDPEYVRSLMTQGSERTLEEAQNRMKLLKTVMGLYGSPICSNKHFKLICTLSILFSRQTARQQAYILQNHFSIYQSKPSTRPLPLVAEDSKIVHFRSRISVSPSASEILAPFKAPGRSCLFAKINNDVPFSSSS